MGITFYSMGRKKKILGPQWNIGNAAALFRLLELPVTEHGDALAFGECELAEAFRKTIKAEALFDKKVPSLIREEVVDQRYFINGLDAEGMWERLMNFKHFLVDCLNHGSTKIGWI